VFNLTRLRLQCGLTTPWLDLVGAIGRERALQPPRQYAGPSIAARRSYLPITFSGASSAAAACLELGEPVETDDRRAYGRRWYHRHKEKTGESPKALPGPGHFLRSA
jgi:hypothetical protein